MRVRVCDFKNDGRWWVIIHSGEKRRVKLCRSHEHALAVAAAIERRTARDTTAMDETAPFAVVAERYLAEGMSQLAPTTRVDRRSIIRGELQHFADVPIGEIDWPTVQEWWIERVEVAGRARATGGNYLDALSAVCGFAAEERLIPKNPIPGCRDQLRSRGKTKARRASGDPTRDVTPIANPLDIGRLLAASAKLDRRGYLATLALTDAGIRVGEVAALDWSVIWWGGGLDDRTRSMEISANRPRGARQSELPKSGLSRRVAMSRRLRAALQKAWVAAGQPESGDVLPGFDARNYRRRHFAPACKAAGIGDRRPKDLRSSFASHLLTLGVPLGWISRTLGHATVVVTAQRYARWLEPAEDGLCEPIPLRHGETYPDLLARLTAGDLASRFTVTDRH